MHKVIEAVSLVVISIVGIWGALLIPSATPGETWAGVIPLGAAIGLLAIAAGMIFSATKVISANESSDKHSENGTRQVLLIIAIAVLYQQSMRWFGYVLPTAIAAPIVLYAFGVRSKFGLLVSVVLCPLVYHVIFFELLGVFPPYGEVFDLLDALQE